MTVENFHATNENDTPKMDAAAFGIDMASRGQVGVIPEQCFNSEALEIAVKLPIDVIVILGSQLTLGLADEKLLKLAKWSEDFLDNRKEKCAMNYYKTRESGKTSSLFF